jgi:hypothetical protein
VQKDKQANRETHSEPGDLYHGVEDVTYQVAPGGLEVIDKHKLDDLGRSGIMKIVPFRMCHEKRTKQFMVGRMFVIEVR